MHEKCKDIGEICDYVYPWLRIVECQGGSRDDFKYGTINENIVVNEIKIKKNDIIVADQSWIICVTQNIIQETVYLLKNI